MTTTAFLPELPQLMVEDQVRAALLEDLGRAGDITSNATIGPERQATAEMNSREAGIISGLPLAAAAFRLIDPAIRFEALVTDGARVEPGTMIARISGLSTRASVRRARGAELSDASVGHCHAYCAVCLAPSFILRQKSPARARPFRGCAALKNTLCVAAVARRTAMGSMTPS